MKKTPKRARSQARRTNAERTRQTRSVLIEAAIELLFARGSAATTTLAVAQRAGLSRGAMLHHFRTRTDLLIAVAEYTVLQQRAQRRAKLQELGVGLRRFHAATAISWEVQKQPGTIALLEIMLATRSDAQLRKRFAPLIQQINDMRSHAATLVAGDLAIKDLPAVSTLLYLHQATLRGLATHLLCTGDDAGVESALRLFTLYTHRFADELMERGARRIEQ